MKIIVTGGTGYIGSHTAVELIHSGYETVIIDNLSNSNLDVLDGIQEITGIKPVFEKTDLTDDKACAMVMEKHKDAIGVIHFAALKAVGESTEIPLAYYKNNICSLINIIDQMKVYKIPHLIFSSSCTVYGQAKELPVTEKSPIKPAESPYGYTKQVGETLIRDCIKAASIPSAISLRYFNPVGAHHSAKIGELPLGTPANLMPFITQTAAGIRESLNVFGNDYETPDGTCIRDYIHIEDLANAHVVALKSLIGNQLLEAYEVFNIGTGKGYSVLEVIQSFEKVSGQALSYKFAPRRPGDIVAIYADPSKANKVLAWNPKYDLDAMTKSAWEWQKTI